MNSAWPLITAGLMMGAGGSLHCIAMCSGLQRMTLRGIPITTVNARKPATQAPAPTQMPHPQGNQASVSQSANGALTSASTVKNGVPASPGNAANGAPPSVTIAEDGAPARSWIAGLKQPDARWWRFQAGRLAGYTLLGATAGFVGQEVLAAASWQPLFESVWAGLNALLVVLGLSLLLLGREPAWLAAAGSKLTSLKPLRPGHRTEWLRGMLWALLPCGLLYTAIATAILAATPLAAAAVMAAFALGTNLGLYVMEAGLHSLMAGKRAQLAYRLNGLILMALAGIGLAAALQGHAHPFC